MDRKKIKKYISFCWLVLLIAFAFYCIFSGRRKPSFTERLGSVPSELQENSDFKFAVFGDTHSFTKSLRSILKKAKKNNCAFAVHLGDFVDLDDDIEYSYFIKRTADLVKDFPVYLVRGNHERMAVEKGFSDNYLKYIKIPYYSFEYGNCLFLVMDNSTGEFDKEQMKYCRKILKSFRSKNSDGHIFLFLHMSPNIPSFSYDGVDSHSINSLASEFNVSYIFGGHIHNYFEHLSGKTKIIITGCGGGSFSYPSKEVSYVEVSVQNSNVKTQKIPGQRDSLYFAIGKYMLFILVPRYRWYCFTGAIILLLIEIFHYMKKPHDPKLKNLAKKIIVSASADYGEDDGAEKS